MTDEPKKCENHLATIKQIASTLGETTLMEICGGHTNAIMKYGIRELLPENITLISGPGCPVCVSSQYDIDCMIALAEKNIPVATYGDMLRVPGSNLSLELARANGGKIHEIYSATDVLSIKDEGIIFYGIGFETTAPMTTVLLESEIPVYSSHKLVPPAMNALISDDLGIDGFINPGHVSTIIGAKAYSNVKIPQVISGFSAEQILRAIKLLLFAISESNTTPINGYPEGVCDEGNITAQKMIEKHFKITESIWRGLGLISDSGLTPRDKHLDAKKIFKDILAEVPQPKATACRCGDILRGLIKPNECPLYGGSCTPKNPVGACMVSDEGTCAIYHRYGK